MSLDIPDDQADNAAGRINGRFYENGHGEQTRIFTDIKGWGVWMVTYCDYRSQGMGHEDAIRAVENEICQTEGKPLPFPPAPPPEPITGRTGRVSIVGRAMRDDQGVESFLGKSLFWAAWGVKHDNARVRDNMAWLQARGVQFIRVLAEVGGSGWADRTVDPREPGWAQQLRDTVTTAKGCGLRVEWTIFGGGCITREADFDRYTDVFIDAMRPHLDAVQFVEIRNEQQGPSDEQARQLASKVRAQLGCITAICGTPENGLDAIYEGSAANALTLHTDRAPAERMYRHIRQIKHELAWNGAWVNNEPRGIASSVCSDDDPVRLAAGAITSWLVGSCAHVIHSGAGIYGRHYVHPGAGERQANVYEQPTLEPTLALIAEAKAKLPKDLPNWQRITHGGPDHPLKFGTAVGDAVEADTSVPGCNRAYAMVAADGRWHCFIAGIQQHVTFSGRTPMAVWSLGTGRVEHVTAGAYKLTADEWSPCVLVSSE